MSGALNSLMGQPQEQELSIRDRIRQRLTESNSKPPLDAVKQQEDQKLDQGLSAREIARQRVNNTEFRSTREVVNDYSQQKDKELRQKQQLQEKTQTQTKVKEQIKEIDHSRRRGGWER